MKRQLLAVRTMATISCFAAITSAVFANVPRSPNILRDAVTPLIELVGGKNTLTGETDGDIINATLEVTEGGTLQSISLVQDDVIMRLPASAYAGLSGARQAWVEERGALTTIVVEGAQDQKDWRLALLFHHEQLWRRRLSVEGSKRDIMTFYDRDKDAFETASKPEPRAAVSRGYYNN